MILVKMTRELRDSVHPTFYSWKNLMDLPQAQVSHTSVVFTVEVLEFWKNGDFVMGCNTSGLLTSRPVV